MIPDWARRGRGGWQYDGRTRPPFAIAPGPGQESVWDYPRPPRLEPEPRTVVVRVGDVLVGRSRACVRVLETASPPTIYMPPGDLVPGGLEAAAGASRCEWKGEARYWTVVAGGQRLTRAGWSYPHPFPEFAAARRLRRLLPRPRRVPGRRRSCPCPAGRLLRRLDHAGDRRTLQGRTGDGGVVSVRQPRSCKLSAISARQNAARRPESAVSLLSC